MKETKKEFLEKLKQTTFVKYDFSSYLAEFQDICLDNETDSGILKQCFQEKQLGFLRDFESFIKEAVELIYQEAFEEGCEEGYGNGHDDGYYIGYEDGKEAGYEEGITEGSRLNEN
jgi:flagellar biosynthesis/type III secretory pathway protein FliH